MDLSLQEYANREYCIIRGKSMPILVAETIAAYETLLFAVVLDAAGLLILVDGGTNRPAIMDATDHIT